MKKLFHKILLRKRIYTLILLQLFPAIKLSPFIGLWFYDRIGKGQFPEGYILCKGVTMKVGILGAGNIASKMAQTLNLMEGAEPYGVASRDHGKAKEFAERYHFKKAYGNYEELMSDPQVDLIYVATPHSHHYEQMKQSLEHGKPVLCEKAFTVNAAQAEEICTLGKQKKLLVAEAIWTRYLPMRKVMDDVLASGVIGKPLALYANLAQPIIELRERNSNPNLAGGALLDMGVYTINFAFMTFGSDGIKDIQTSMETYHTGVDASSSTTITYNDGKKAMLFSSMMVKGDRAGVVYGDKGYIRFKNINNCEGIEVYGVDDKPVAVYYTPKQFTGFEYQVEACKKAIEKGETECPHMPHVEILKVMKTMDAIRKVWGLKYPFE
jgi:predicted dehydrogenase